MIRKTQISVLGLFFIVTILCTVTFADSILSWQAVSGTVTGYRIYYGTAPASYTSSRDVGNVTQFPLGNLSLSQGRNYYFIIRAYNSTGESTNSNEVSWIVPDTTPPLPPVSVAVQNGSSTLSWAANTEADFKEYRLYYGTTAGSYLPFIPVGKVTNYTISGLQRSTRYYFALTSVDNSGNESTYSTVVSSTISDSQAPVVSVSLPTTAATYTATTNIISLSGTANDNVGVATVTWDNSLGGSGTASGTSNWTVANLNLSSGNNRITIRARDAAGNSAEKILTVTYIPPVVSDTTAPTLAITTPTSNATYSTNNASLSISGTASDNIGVTRINWRNSTGGSGQATGTGSWAITNIVLREGDNGITVTAMDAAGNITPKIITVTYTAPDTTAPVVSIISPSGSGAYQTNNATLNCSGTASDNKAVSQVRWSNDRGGSGIAVGTTSWAISGLALAGGTNRISIAATDAAGNTGRSAITVTYNPPDTVDPTVSIVTPTTAGTYATGTSSVNLSGNASDNVGVTQVRWSNSRGGSGIAAGTQSWSITGINLLEGQNVIGVSAVDAAGNSAIRNFIVTYTPPDTTRPIVAIVAPTATDAYVTNTASINLAGTAGDNVGVRQVNWKNSRGGEGIATGRTSWNISNIGLALGQNILTVSADDNAGNIGSDVITITYTPSDTTPPVISFTSPVSGSYYATNRINIIITGTASDNVGVKEVKWSNNRGGSGLAIGTTNWSTPGINLSPGSNSITITAQDNSGNQKINTLTIDRF